MKQENEQRIEIFSRHRRGVTMLELLVVVAVIALLAGILLAAVNVIHQRVTESHTKAVLSTCQAVLEDMLTENQKLGIVPPNHFYEFLDANNDGKPDLRGEYDWSLETYRYTIPDWRDPEVQAMYDAKASVNPKEGDELNTGGTSVITDRTPEKDATADDQYNNDPFSRYRFIERFVWVAFRNNSGKQLLDTLSDKQLMDSDFDGYLEVLDGWEYPIIYVNGVDEENDSQLKQDADGFLPQRDKPYFASAGADGLWGDVRAKQTSDLYKASEDNLYSYDLE